MLQTVGIFAKMYICCCMWRKINVLLLLLLLFVISSTVFVVVISRLHLSTTYVDAAYCYRPRSVVCLSH